MFSNSTNNIINPFAQLPSSYHHPPALSPQPPLLSHDSNDIFLNQHHDLLPASCWLPVNPQITESLINIAVLNNAIMTKQNGAGGPHGNCLGASGFGIPVKKPAKKDRHSKICTAQGIRDRRVRLSIEISRKFFDLQDMLGFDKASKTLEWLLTKSQPAIRELEKMKHGNGSNGGKRSLTSSPECEMVAENDGGELEGTALKSKSVELRGVGSEEKKMKRLHKATVPLPEKDSRAKARARARERTREKMCTSSTTKERKRSCPDTSPQFLNQLRSLTRLEVSKESDHSYGHNMASSFKVHLVEKSDHSYGHNMESSFKVHLVEESSPRQLPSAAPGENVVEEEEPIVRKRKSKASTILGYQQNIAAASKDVCCSSSGDNYFPKLPQNWDINGACNGTL